MKYGTLVIIKVLSSFYQQDIFDQQRRDQMLEIWENALSSKDIGTLQNVVDELLCYTKYPLFVKELNKVKEELL